MYHTANFSILFFGHKINMCSHQSLNKEIANQTRVIIHKKLKMLHQNQINPNALPHNILSISPRKYTNHLGSTQYQIAIQIKVLSSHCCRTAMVALDTTNGDNAVSALRDGICHQKLELPDLVTAQLHA